MQSEHSQLLKVIDDTGRVIYRVQLPREGRTIFLGWEPSGAALAAVQDHGGAFLWFPSKPDCVQQWEGMQFSSQMLRSSALKRNSHFDTCFASWSETRKLVLGLADGNFACWDLASNETFVSRKHFAGKHKNAITCGAWGMQGQILALGSKNQLKVSAPLLNASWESTAAKLTLNDNELTFQELSFSPSGQTLSVRAPHTQARRTMQQPVARMISEPQNSTCDIIAKQAPYDRMGTNDRTHVAFQCLTTEPALTTLDVQACQQTSRLMRATRRPAHRVATNIHLR